MFSIRIDIIAFKLQGNETTKIVHHFKVMFVAWTQIVNHNFGLVYLYPIFLIF